MKRYAATATLVCSFLVFATPGATAPHWSYAGPDGPEHWSELSPDFAVCGVGRRQSPIDLRATSHGRAPVPTSVTGVRGRLTVKQRARVMDLVDNGHTIQITNDAPVSLDIDGTHYELVQYHFHAPSEHTLAGEHAPLEVHFVHKSAVGELAVLGILVQEGAYDAVWDPVLSALPAGPEDARHLEGLELDAEALQPTARRFFRYDGSLTTPPCSEGVKWIIPEEPRHMSRAQLDAITPLLQRNHRRVQKRNDREILLLSLDELDGDSAEPAP